MTRDQWRKRMIEAGIPEEVVDVTLDSMSDEDFARVKDTPPEQLLAGLLEAAGGVPKDKDASDTGAEDSTDDQDVVDITEAFEQLKSEVVALVKDTMGAATAEQEFTVELPELVELQNTVAGLVKDMADMKDALVDMLKSEEERLAALNKDMSAASRSRLVVYSRAKDGAMSDDDIAAIAKAINEKYAGAEQRQQQHSGPIPPGGRRDIPGFEPVIKDAAGRTYKSFAEMMTSSGSGQ